MNISTQKHRKNITLSHNSYLSRATRNTIPLVVSTTAILSPLAIVHSVGSMKNDSVSRILENVAA